MGRVKMHWNCNFGKFGISAGYIDPDNFMEGSTPPPTPVQPTPPPTLVKDDHHVLQTSKGSGQCVAGDKHKVLREVTLGGDCLQFSYTGGTLRLSNGQCVDYFR